TSGNHDSAIRLGFMSRMMRNAGGHIRTMPETITEPIIFDEHRGTVCRWAVSHLVPSTIAQEFGVDAKHYSVVSSVMEQVRPAMGQRGLTDATHIMMAHLFAAGATGSDSEKNIGEGTEVGTLGQVPADMFEDMDYVALGHLHGRQTISE